MTVKGTLQTPTTMEACMKLASGPEAVFWNAQEQIGPVVAEQPGFQAVIGGPIANSSWTYFCGKFETPAHMDQWYESPKHKPVMDGAYAEWFDAFYIRKWRLPAPGEKLQGPLFLETTIVPGAKLAGDLIAALIPRLQAGLDKYGTLPFETLSGQYEPQPFQFVGPLEEFPQPAPVRYLMVTHWKDEHDLNAWLDSPEAARLGELGDVTTTTHVQVRHAPGERRHLTADGALRGWQRPKKRA